MKTFRRAVTALSLLLSLLSCRKEGNVIYIDPDEDTELQDLVYFVTRKGALGDVGYMDDMYRGAVRGAQDCGLLFSLVELPADTLKAVSTIEYMLDYMQNEEPERRALIILANDSLEPLLHRYDALLTRASNVDFLLAESDDTTLSAHTLKILQYGIYYQAGRLVADGLDDVDEILIASANPDIPGLDGMTGGFSAAIEDSGSGSGLTTISFSDTTGGYDDASTAYKMSYSLDGKFDLVLPLCGGTAQGFFRYNRENPGSFYTLGVDCDMQLYSPRVPFSIVKHIGDAVQDWICDWWRGAEMPSHQVLDLSSGYSELVVSDSFDERLTALAGRYYDKALEEERKYAGL